MKSGSDNCMAQSVLNSGEVDSMGCESAWVKQLVLPHRSWLFEVDKNRNWNAYPLRLPRTLESQLQVCFYREYSKKTEDDRGFILASGVARTGRGDRQYDYSSKMTMQSSKTLPMLLSSKEFIHVITSFVDGSGKPSSRSQGLTQDTEVYMA